MDIRAIREALAEVFDLAGWRTYSILPPGGELPLAAVGWPEEVTYTSTLTGGGELTIIVSLAYPLTDWEVAQHAIDAVMSTPGPLEDLDFIGGPWQDAHVVGAGNVRQVSLDAPALVVDVEIEILV